MSLDSAMAVPSGDTCTCVACARSAASLAGT